MLVTPWSLTAAIIFTGSTCAGRVGSMSGMTDVIPKAGSKRAKSGKVARSISPVEMRKWDLMAAIWAAKIPCV